MPVAAPPRPPDSSAPGSTVPIDQGELEALIEEARRRARRRRRKGAAALLVAGAGVAALIGFGGRGGGGGGGGAGSVALADGSGAEGQATAAAPSLAALPAGARPSAFAFDAARPNIVYVTSAHDSGGVYVYRTADGGRHWQPTGARGPNWESDILSLTADPVDPGTLYAGTDTAVYKTVDGGRTWRPFNQGLFPPPGGERVCYRLPPFAKRYCARQPQNFGTAGTTSWNRNNGYVAGIAVDPSDSSVVYSAAGAVRKSTDGGRSWTTVLLPYSPQLHWYSVTRIVIAPTRPESIYVIAHTNTGRTAIYKSTDAGSHWHATGGSVPGLPKSGSPGSTDALAVDPRHPQTIYAAVGGTVLKTTNGGAQWQSVTHGLPPGDATSLAVGLPAGNVTSLAADPQRPGTLYAGLRTGPYKGTIYTTTDGGSSWTTMAVTGAAISALAVNPARPTTIWAVGWAGETDQSGAQTWKPHIYRSTDRGHTWTTAP